MVIRRMGYNLVSRSSIFCLFYFHGPKMHFGAECPAQCRQTLPLPKMRIPIPPLSLSEPARLRQRRAEITRSSPKFIPHFLRISELRRKIPSCLLHIWLLSPLWAFTSSYFHENLIFIFCTSVFRTRFHNKMSL